MRMLLAAIPAALILAGASCAQTAERRYPDPEGMTPEIRAYAECLEDPSEHFRQAHTTEESSSVDSPGSTPVDNSHRWANAILLSIGGASVLGFTLATAGFLLLGRVDGTEAPAADWAILAADSVMLAGAAISALSGIAWITAALLTLGN